MIQTPLSPPIRAFAPGSAPRFTTIMLGLTKAMANRFGRHPSFSPLATIIRVRPASTHVGHHRDRS